MRDRLSVKHLEILLLFSIVAFESSMSECKRRIAKIHYKHMIPKKIIYQHMEMYGNMWLGRPLSSMPCPYSMDFFLDFFRTDGKRDIYIQSLLSVRAYINNLKDEKKKSALQAVYHSHVSRLNECEYHSYTPYIDVSSIEEDVNLNADAYL